MKRDRLKKNDILFSRTHQHTNFKSYYPLLAVKHCGIESSDSEANLQQRQYCDRQRATWGPRGPQEDGGAPNHRPEEAPHTLAAMGQWRPGRERERGRGRVKGSRRGLPGIGQASLVSSVVKSDSIDPVY